MYVVCIKYTNVFFFLTGPSQEGCASQDRSLNVIGLSCQQLKKCQKIPFVDCCTCGEQCLHLDFCLNIQ